MRYRQLLSTRSEDIAELLVNLRRVQAVPQPDYHFRKHGEDLGVDNVDAYQAASRRFLGRDDLRVFSYLRPKDNTAMWELVAPDNGTTVMYNESRKAILSFLRPDDAAARMEAAQGWWIELWYAEHMVGCLWSIGSGTKQNADQVSDLPRAST